MEPILIFQIIVLIYSIIIHEIAHGYAAYIFGDRTALYMGRLTLNPLPHIDPFGSLLLPFMLLISGGGIIAGYAKPVPVNENNLQNGNTFFTKRGFASFCVSFAGVFVNLLLAIVFALIGSLLLDSNLKTLCFVVATTNLGLAIFNLLPIPPADGYRILSIFLPRDLQNKIDNLINQYLVFFLIGAIFVASLIFSQIFPYFLNILRQIIF
jgi:Zn-dependent protease